jgi:pyridoxal phosphate enzyme (YggS family)
MSRIADNVARILEEVAQAAIDCARDPAAVRILAATKYTDRAGATELARAGIILFGENRVQDASAKYGPSAEGVADSIRHLFPDCRLHFIGHLQRNKVNQALRLFDLVETVDRMSLVDGLEKRLTVDDRALPVLVEVKLTGEETKTGCPIDDLPALLDHLWRKCPHLAVRGLMGMGPWDPDPEVARPFYRRLKELFESNRPNAPDRSQFDTLSMGMSGDFRIAIEEGATLLRIGRAFFE